MSFLEIKLDSFRVTKLTLRNSGKIRESRIYNSLTIYMLWLWLKPKNIPQGRRQPEHLLRRSGLEKHILSTSRQVLHCFVLYCRVEKGINRLILGAAYGFWLYLTVFFIFLRKKKSFFQTPEEQKSRSMTQRWHISVFFFTYFSLMLPFLMQNEFPDCFRFRSHILE